MKNKYHFLLLIMYYNYVIIELKNNKNPITIFGLFQTPFKKIKFFHFETIVKIICKQKEFLQYEKYLQHAIFKKVIFRNTYIVFLLQQIKIIVVALSVSSMSRTPINKFIW